MKSEVRKVEVAPGEFWPLEKCSECGGDGRIEISDRCTKCGPGWGGQWCSRCGNSGYESDHEEDCPQCEGEGEGIWCWNCRVLFGGEKCTEGAWTWDPVEEAWGCPDCK